MGVWLGGTFVENWSGNGIEVFKKKKKRISDFSSVLKQMTTHVHLYHRQCRFRINYYINFHFFPNIIVFSIHLWNCEFQVWLYLYNIFLETPYCMSILYCSRGANYITQILLRPGASDLTGSFRSVIGDKRSRDFDCPTQTTHEI